ncbi:hypothetical protein [Streptomyces sp. NPDC051219]
MSTLLSRMPWKTFDAENTQFYATCSRLTKSKAYFEELAASF